MTSHRAGTRARNTGTELVPFALSLIAGMVDVTSFVLLKGLFTAHITGNVVVLAADVAAHRPVRLLTVLAVVVFIAVTAALAAAVDGSRRAPYQWAGVFLWLQFAFLGATAATATVLDSTGRHGASGQAVVATLAVAAMACQNALLHLTFGRAPSTAVMTGNIVASTVALVGLAAGRLRHADRTADRTAWLALRPLLLGFIAGCVLGALASEMLNGWAWTAPALLGGVLAAGVSNGGLPVLLRRDATAPRRERR
jgi:uncharacterized membrane protein YoaK (UPF0700 family)